MAMRYTVGNPDGTEIETPSERRAQDWMLRQMLQQQVATRSGGGGSGADGSIASDSFFNEPQQGPNLRDVTQSQRDLINARSAAAMALDAQQGANRKDIATLDDAGQTTRQGIATEPGLITANTAKADSEAGRPARIAEALAAADMAKYKASIAKGAMDQYNGAGAPPVGPGPAGAGAPAGGGIDLGHGLTLPGFGQPSPLRPQAAAPMPAPGVPAAPIGRGNTFNNRLVAGVLGLDPHLADDPNDAIVQHLRQTIADKATAEGRGTEALAAATSGDYSKLDTPERFDATSVAEAEQAKKLPGISDTLNDIGDYVSSVSLYWSDKNLAYVQDAIDQTKKQMDSARVSPQAQALVLDELKAKISKALEDESWDAGYGGADKVRTMIGRKPVHAPYNPAADTNQSMMEQFPG